MGASRSWWRGAACFSLGGLIVALALWTDRPNVRYAEYPHQCRMIFVQEGVVDLAVIGSSRSMRVFQADLLADLVADIHGFRPIIHDLSRAYRDPGHMLPFVKDAAKHHAIRTLLVEFKETGEQWRHPHFERNGTIVDIVTAYQSRPSVDPVLRLRDVVRDLLDRIVYRATSWLTDDLGKDCSDRPPVPTATTDPSKPWVIDASLIKKIQQKQDKPFDQKPLYRVDLEAAEEERNLHYMGRFSAFAKEQQIELFFYYIPPLFGRPLAPDVVRAFEERFDAPLLQLDAADLATLNPLGFTDGTHMGWPAAKRYMNYLADALPWTQRNSEQ